MDNELEKDWEEGWENTAKQYKKIHDCLTLKWNRDELGS